MSNLYDETTHLMETNGYIPSDVLFVSDGAVSCSFDDFSKIAQNHLYDRGYGAAEVNESLVVVFCDGSWLDRREYDGSEWWAINRKPKKPDSEGVLELRSASARWDWDDDE